MQTRSGVFQASKNAQSWLAEHLVEKEQHIEGFDQIFYIGKLPVRINCSAWDYAEH